MGAYFQLNRVGPNYFRLKSNKSNTRVKYFFNTWMLLARRVRF